jgi:hypothetical protein
VKWVVVWPGCADPQEYEQHTQEGAAMYTDASVKAALARVNCSYGEGIALLGNSSQCKYVTLLLM